MPKKYYDEEINKYTDWGGDESTEFLPVKGNRVQEFIKKTLNGKMGIFHYDETNNRYIVFADDETRNSYLEDPTQTELILGTFDAPFNYTATITLKSESYVAILTGEKNNVIKFNFDVTNKQGASVVENVLCTYTFIKGSSKKVVKARYRYGQDVSFNIDNYLEDGTNNIIIAITGEGTLAATSVSVTYQVVNLQISDDIDISKTYNTGDIIDWSFSVKGVGTKIVEWWLDGVMLPKEEGDEVIQTEVKRHKNINLSGVGVGVHNIQLRAYTTINGEVFYSKTLFREIIIPERTTVNRTYIAIAYEAPAGEIYDNGVDGALSDFPIYAKQYEDCSFRIAVHNTINSAQVPVIISLGDSMEDSEFGYPYPITGKELTTLMMQNNVERVYSFVPEESGFKFLRTFWSEDSYDPDYAGFTGNYYVQDYGVRIQKSDVVLNEITENRELYLNAKGKSNDSKDKDSWKYAPYKAIFEGFEWNTTSGWNDGALVIPNGASMSLLEDALMGEVPYAPLSGVTSKYLESKGKTIELELGSKDVLNDDAVLLDMTDNGVGLKITASEAILTSSDGVKVSSKYKSGEFIRLSFVINPSQKAENSGLALLYIDGIVSGAINFSTTDSFRSNAQFKISGSAEATAILRNISIYNAALTKEEILNNRIIYARENKISLISNNDIFDEETNEVSYEKLANQLPVMIITGDIPTLEAASNKKVKIKADIQYIDNQNPERSFTVENASMTPQGTSSIGYPAKNFKIYFKDRPETVVKDSTGKTIDSKKLTVFPNGLPVDIFCIKADFAESSGTHNTGLARLWNNVLKNAKISKIDDRYYDKNNPKYGKEYQNSVFMTSAQKIAATNGYKYDVRTTIDGRPICMFYRLDANSELKFMGKYNLNNDKSTEAVFGFVGLSEEHPEGIPGFDNSNMQCWEVLNNSTDLALFTDVSNFGEWGKSYESRYPDGDPGEKRLENLKRLCIWINSTKDAPNNEDVLNEFKSKKWEYFDVYKLAAYYVYLMRHGAVDQTVKNAMLTSEDGKHYYYILYDNDTTHGLRNDSILIYPPTIDRKTEDPTFAVITYAFAGHDSVLWNNLEADDEFKEIVAQVDAALYAAGLSLKNVLDMLDNQQAGKWSETVYNYDAQYKYIRPYNDGNNKLFALQGSRKSHRDWWLSKRFSLYDAKWVTGDYKNQNIEFKAVLPEGYVINSLGFTIKSGYKMDYGYGVNEIVKAKNKMLDIDATHRFTIDQRLQIGDPARIYAANNIKELDLSELTQYLALLDVGKAYSESLGTKLEKLVVGSPDGINTSLQGGISGLGKCTRLKYLDITNVQSITKLEGLDNLINLQELYATGSGLKGVEFAEGAKLTYIELPEGLNALTLTNVSTLTSKENINIANWGNIRTLKLINCGNLAKDMSIPLNWARLMESNTSSMADADKKNYYAECNLTITNINWSNVNIDDLLVIGRAYKNGCKGYLTGYIKLTSCNDEQMAMLEETFGANIFNPNSELFISIPDGVFIYGDNSVIEGESLQLTARVISENPGEITWSIISGGTSYQSIDSNGLLTTTEYGATRSVTVQVKHIPTSGAIVTATMSIEIVKAVRPTGGTISGQDALSGEGEYTLDVIPSDTNKPYSVNWTLSGEGYDNGYVSIKSHSNNNCVLQSTSDAVGNFKLVATITGGETSITIEKTIILGVLLTLNISSNQGEDSDIDSLSATVQYNDKNVTARNGVAIGVPKNTQCTISFPDVEGYRKPDTIEIVSGDSSITKDVTYETEVVKVTLTSLDDLDIIGQTVTINNQQFTWRGTEISKKVAFGTEYTVTASKKDEYSTPTLTFTANQAVRNVELVYTMADIAVSRKTNPEVMDCLYSAGLCANANYMTKDEAAAVTEEQLKPSGGNSIFYNNRKIKTFNEFKHFTSILQIPSKCFYSCYYLTSIEIPNSVTSIGNMTFYGCSRLTSVTIPNSVTSIGSQAFSDCYDLTSVTIGNSVTSIGNEAFYGCSGLTSVTIPNSVTSIGERAFFNCGSLTSVTIGNSVTSIGSQAFSKCSGLTSVSIPNSVTSIGSNAFYECSGLESIVVESGNSKYDSRDNCNAIIETATNTLLAGCKNTTIPNSVTKIGYGAFSKRSGLTSVTIPNSVTSIGDSAFEGCSGLTSVSIPNSVKSISNYTFAQCSSLTSVSIPNSVTSIGSNAFAQCSSLTSVSIPNSVKSIAIRTFYECSSLTSVTIGNSVTSIGSQAFSNCSNLESIRIFATTAPTVKSSTFGDDTSSYTGRNNYDKGTNILYVPSGATDYNASYWANPLQDSTKCGFTISYTL